MLREKAAQARKDLTYGLCLILFSSWLGEFIALLVIMTPDPDHKIHYGLVGIVLCIFAVMFLYGLYKLDKVEKMLSKILF